MLCIESTYVYFCIFRIQRLAINIIFVIKAMNTLVIPIPKMYFFDINGLMTFNNDCSFFLLSLGIMLIIIFPSLICKIL